MKITKGDKVRFLNEVGGGVVSRVEGGRMVYVLDEDGFEIPVLSSEVVLVEKSEGKLVEDTPIVSSQIIHEDYEYEENETDGEVKLLFACIRSKELSGNVILYLVNDSNYFAFYTIGLKDSESVENSYIGIIEPNTKIELDKPAINFLDGKEYEVQVIVYRKKIKYKPVNPICEKIKFSGSKLLKGSSFVMTDYFKDRACLLYIVKGSFEEKLDQLSAKEIEKVIVQKESKPKVPEKKRKNTAEILEVDLHIHELLDDTRGMSNKEILDYQMEKFHQTMNENKDNKNKKVVFIHGKGNGVLKSEIVKALKRKYKWHSYQDASFKEYGYGATMVLI